MENDRRAKARYPIELNVHYQTFGRSSPVFGIGRTLNLSSSGVFVATAGIMTEGVRLKLTIEWPSLLNGITPLQLVTSGRVVRCNAVGFAVVLEHYQFRTMKQKPKVIAKVDWSALVAAAGEATTRRASTNAAEARSVGKQPLDRAS